MYVELACRPIQYLEIRITVFIRQEKETLIILNCFVIKEENMEEKECWGRWSNEIVDYSRAAMGMPPQALSEMFNSSTKVSTPADF